MIRTLQAFLADESAVTAIEYAMIAGIMAIVIVPAVGSLGGTLNGFFIALSGAFP
jgi:pilus assembly protein Flp/PilA